MGKNIIFCADGTWNGPDQDEDHDLQPDPTNVYKLFLALDGRLDYELRQADEQEKRLDEGGEAVQVAKYIHGVGDSRNPIVKLLGGAFGAGIISRIVRGYTFVSRNYQDGDRIVLAGFSRGAYTARALGGLIASQGLLAPELTRDQEQAYRLGAKAWYQYRQSSRKQGIIDRLTEVAADLPAFLSRDLLPASSLVAGVSIEAIAVWDTVGALGLPLYLRDRRIDAFRFADGVLDAKVGHGLHAVSLDEQRLDFTPTLWQARAGITQLLFPGAHADVGGGYPSGHRESGLSDLALQWMAAQLGGLKVRLTMPGFEPFSPDPGATAHQPWRQPPFDLGRTGLRDFGPPVAAATGINVHPAVGERMALGPVLADPAAAPAPYRPANLP